jgi:hypothetical protein
MYFGTWSKPVDWILKCLEGPDKILQIQRYEEHLPPLHVQLALFLKKFWVKRVCGVKSIFMTKINISMRVNFVTSIFKSFHYLGTIFRFFLVLNINL